MDGLFEGLYAVIRRYKRGSRGYLSQLTVGNAVAANITRAKSAKRCYILLVSRWGFDEDAADSTAKGICSSRVRIVRRLLAEGANRGNSWAASGERGWTLVGIVR